jgi:hypothetical protein
VPLHLSVHVPVYVSVHVPVHVPVPIKQGIHFLSVQFISSPHISHRLQ